MPQDRALLDSNFQQNKVIIVSEGRQVGKAEISTVKDDEAWIGGKGGRSVQLAILPISCDDCLEMWEPQSPGTLRAFLGLFRDCFAFTF